MMKWSLRNLDLSGYRWAQIIVIIVVVAGALIELTAGRKVGLAENGNTEISNRSKRTHAPFRPTPAQWAGLTVEPVQQRFFRSEITTEGKIAVDEDRSTLVFSPYAGRVMKLFAKPGDTVTVGQPLFTVEATDMVQAQNDFIGTATGLNKARSALNLAQITDKRQRLLYDAKAVPLRDVQQARGALDAAENDLRSAEVALAAVHNRLRILGKSDQEITEFQTTGTINPATPIYAPITGTIVQRKVGPGQYIGNGASDPVFIVGDLSTVWLISYVRETDAPKVYIGQTTHFTVLADPNRVYETKITYAAAILDATTRRLFVRAAIDNSERRLMPEMFARIRILAEAGISSLSVPRRAVMYEGDGARVWVVNEEQWIELRSVKTGLTSGDMVQVLDGLEFGEKVVTQGSVFIDREATSSR